MVRKRIIDDTSPEARKEQLKQVCPWIVQFTPSFEGEVEISEPPPKRPPSPFSGRPLRAKDLVPVTLTKEAPGSDKYICPVTRKTITNQKLVLLPTGTLMLESAAQELAYPTLTCPLVGARFHREEVIEIAASTSAFAATGDVVAKKFKASAN